MAEENTAVPVSSQEPGRGDEATPEAGTQSPAADTQPTEAGSTLPPEADAIAQPEPQEVLDKRLRDTQRALSERERHAIQLEAENRVLREVAQGRGHVEQNQNIEAEMKAMEEEVRNDPANAVKIFYRTLAQRDQYFHNALEGVRHETARQVVESSAEFAQVRDGIESLQDVQEFKFLSPKAQVDIVSRLQKKAGGQRQLQPPGAPVGSRKAAAVAPKEQTKEEKYRPFLVASGAISEGKGGRNVPYVMER